MFAGCRFVTFPSPVPVQSRRRHLPFLTLSLPHSPHRDDQTSADASFNGTPAGSVFLPLLSSPLSHTNPNERTNERNGRAMSWAFIKSLGENPNQSYIGVLQSTRGLLMGKYQQVPQLSVSGLFEEGGREGERLRLFWFWWGIGWGTV